jgi:hypothetical protein
MRTAGLGETLVRLFAAGYIGGFTISREQVGNFFGPYLDIRRRCRFDLARLSAKGAGYSLTPNGVPRHARRCASPC